MFHKNKETSPSHFRAWRSHRRWLYTATVFIALIGGGVATTGFTPKAAADTITSPALSNATVALSSAASSAQAQGIPVGETGTSTTPSYASAATASDVANTNANNLSAYNSAASSASSLMTSEASSLATVTNSYSSTVASYNTTARRKFVEEI